MSYTVVSAALGAGLIGLAIGALRLRPWARRGLLIYARVDLVLLTLSLAANILVTMPVLRRVPAAPGAERIARRMMEVAQVAIDLAAMSYPICVLVFLRRPDVVAAFTPAEHMRDTGTGPATLSPPLPPARYAQPIVLDCALPGPARRRPASVTFLGIAGLVLATFGLVAITVLLVGYLALIASGTARISLPITVVVIAFAVIGILLCGGLLLASIGILHLREKSRQTMLVLAIVEAFLAILGLSLLLVLHPMSALLFAPLALTHPVICILLLEKPLIVAAFRPTPELDATPKSPGFTSATGDSPDGRQGGYG